MSAAKQGYDTVYRRQRFRSRLEARWAAFFDLIEWPWEYEPFDAHRYIPDFAVVGDCALLVDVKPALDLDALFARTDWLDTALDGYWRGDVLAVGATPLFHETKEHRVFYDALPAAGVLGQWLDYSPGGRSWDVGLWAACECHYPAAVAHQTMSFRRNPCGFYDGDTMNDPPGDLEDRWREAGAVTRWEPAEGSKR